MRKKKDVTFLTGDYSKEKIKELKNRKIKAKCTNIVAPEYLTEELKERFYTLAYALDDKNMLSDLDYYSLAYYIVAESQYIRLYGEISKYERYTKRYYELIKLQYKFFRQAREAAADLGITVLNRSGLVFD